MWSSVRDVPYQGTKRGTVKLSATVVRVRVIFPTVTGSQVILQQQKLLKKILETTTRHSYCRIYKKHVGQ